MTGCTQEEGPVDSVVQVGQTAGPEVVYRSTAEVTMSQPVKHQWRSQNAKKVTHIKGRLLDQVVLFNCIPFQSGNFS